MATEQAETEQVMQAVYAHLRWVREERLAFRESLLQKVHRLMTFHMLLFAALAYGINEMEWVWEHSGWHMTIIVSVAGLAALSLLLAFFAGLMCCRVTEVSAIAVRVLADTIRDGQIRRVQLSDVHSDLSQNLGEAIRQDQERSSKQKKWGWFLNLWTFAGLVLTAAFITYTMVGKVYFCVEH